jgi:HTH-type transcriptional regulator / antitoxin HigA
MRQSLATMEEEQDAAPTIQPINPIRNEADYELALQEIDRCLDAAAGSSERDRLEVWTVLVDDYEPRHHPISSPD